MNASGLIIIGYMILTAGFIFGIAMVSKAIRSEKANNAEKGNNAGKKVIAAKSAAILMPLLALGVAAACVGCKSDKTEASAPETVVETTTGAITTTTEETTKAASTTTTTTETITTTTTEPPTEAVTVPLSELSITGKGNEAGFGCRYYSDGSIIIDSVIDESYKGQIHTYKEVYGTDATNVIIPREANGYTIRAVDLVFVENGYPSLGWRDVKAVSVPKEMTLISNNGNEISFDEAAALFSQYGVTLSAY